MVGQNQELESPDDVVVYKSPTCGCCAAWIDHLQDNGYTVDVHNQRDSNRIKNELGVPAKLRSCHTAVIEGYVIEGRVPATNDSAPVA